MRKKILYSKRFYLICVLGIAVLLPTMILVRFYRGKRKAEREWHNQKAKIRKITNLGTTTTLEILPLIDWHVSHKHLKREAGVSYQVVRQLAGHSDISTTRKYCLPCGQKTLHLQMVF